MYVFIANGFKGIIESKQTLDILASIYPYPKFRRVASREDAVKFLERYDRGEVKPRFENYGETDRYYGYATVSYFIDKGDLFVSIDTSKVGFIRIDATKDKGIVVDNRPSLIKVRVPKMMLDDNLISDHCLAIQYILELLGGYVDVNIQVPDISIYLALTKYTGSVYMISDCRNLISTRLGGTSITIK